MKKLMILLTVLLLMISCKSTKEVSKTDTAIKQTAVVDTNTEKSGTTTKIAVDSISLNFATAGVNIIFGDPGPVSETIVRITDSLITSNIPIKEITKNGVSQSNKAVSYNNTTIDETKNTTTKDATTLSAENKEKSTTVNTNRIHWKFYVAFVLLFLILVWYALRYFKIL